MASALGRLVLFVFGCAAAAQVVASEDVRDPQQDSALETFDDNVFGEGSDDATVVAVDVADPASIFGIGWQPFVKARPPQASFRRPSRALVGRDCLANGTNFCFGNSVNSCSSCGSCCSSTSSKWCCPSDGVCCGSSCCASGQTCNNGQCFLPVVTVTATSDVVVTSTQTVTQIVTIVEQIIETTEVNSIVEVTTSSESATQTNWIYVTVTTVDKRAEPTWRSESVEIDEPDVERSQEVLEEEVGLEDSPGEEDRCEQVFTVVTEVHTPAATLGTPFHSLDRRQATAEDLSATAATTTVSQVITTTAVTSKTESSTITTTTTSVDTSTVVQTNTQILGAMATVEATSTLTFTSHHPVTRTITMVATAHGSGDPTTSSSAAPELITHGSGPASGSRKLASGAIAGIAIGSAVAALIAGLLAFCLLRRRHQRRAQQRREEADLDGYLGASPVIGGHKYTGPPPPAAAGYGHGHYARAPPAMAENTRGLPPVPFFASVAAPTATAAAVHNRTSSAVTAGTTVVGGSGRTSLSLSLSLSQNKGKSMAAGGGGAKPHQRASSGISASTAGTLTEGRETGADRVSPQEVQPPQVQVQPPQPQPRPSSSSPPPIHVETTADTNHLTAPWSPTTGGSTDNTSQTSSPRSSFHNGQSNVVTSSGGFFYRDY